MAMATGNAPNTNPGPPCAYQSTASVSSWVSWVRKPRMQYTTKPLISEAPTSMKAITFSSVATS